MSTLTEKIMDDVQAKGREISLLITELQNFEESYDPSLLSVEERTQAAAFRELVETLVEAENVINFYNKKVRFEGYPILQASGQYIAGEKELASGSVVEVMEDVLGDKKQYRWRRTHIEYGTAYYAVGFPKAKLDELRVRIR